MYKEDIIETEIKKEGRELLRKSEGFVENAQYIELELFYDERWLPEPYILTASKGHGTLAAEKFSEKEEAEADYQSLRDKYNLKISTPQK